MDLKPGGFLDEQKHPAGMFYEIGKRIIEETDLAAEYEVVPYARAINYVETGVADMVIMLPNEPLKQGAIEVANLFSFEHVILGPAGSHYTSLQDLHGKVIGKIRGAKYDETFDADAAITKYEVNTYEQLIKMLIAQRLDGVIGTKDLFYIHAQKLGYEFSQFSEPFVLNRKDVVLFLSKHCTDRDIVSTKLRTAVETLASQNVFQPIVEHWLQY